MTVSTDGQICYGILFPEDYEFAWDEEGIDDWWLKVCGYKPLFQLWGEDEEYMHPKPSEEMQKQYYDYYFKFQKEHPIPVELVNYCSGGYPMYILTVPKATLNASRGYPTEFDPNKLWNLVTNEGIDHYNCFIKFIEKHCKPRNDSDEFPSLETKWYLSSYWSS